MISECASGPILFVLRFILADASNPILAEENHLTVKMRSVSLRSVHMHSINVFTVLCMQVNLKNKVITVQVIFCEKRQVTSLRSQMFQQETRQQEADTERLSDS